MIPPLDKQFRTLRDKTAGLGKDKHRDAYAALARKLVERRTELGLSQTQLAEMCGTTQSAIARLEQGVRPPRVDTLLTIAEAMQCEVVVDLRPIESDKEEI